MALDLDGTIACGGALDAAAMSAIRAARAAGVVVLLVTGRILTELEADLPGLIDEFDLVVAENGGVLRAGGVVTALVSAVPEELPARLEAFGARVRRGEVLVACDASAAHIALDAVRLMQLDVQLVWNREALMLVPGGVSKGTGVSAGLAALGISPHSAIGVGDAENDHPLLEVCELGVAVGNAVPALAKHADLVLPEPNGTGVAKLLDDVAHAVDLPLPPRRRLVVGTATDDGRVVTIPASPTRVLITGGSGAGKSYVTGLLAEQMIELGYSVLLIDPEGDHTGLTSLHASLLVGDAGRLPAPGELAHILEHGRSVVLDLSLAPGARIGQYVQEVHRQLREHRRRTGLPHWFVIDEAHLPLGLESAVHDWGYCLTTYRPEGLPPQARANGGWRIHVDRPGEAVLTPPEGAASSTVRVRVGCRRTRHVRHHHKYLDTNVARDRGFHFRDDTGRTGVVATNVREFVRELGRCDAAVLAHHARGGDLARWIRDVLGDPVLAGAVAQIENRVPAPAPDAARSDIIELVSTRYGIKAAARP